jgi:hypothetical protein
VRLEIKGEGRGSNKVNTIYINEDGGFNPYLRAL